MARIKPKAEKYQACIERIAAKGEIGRGEALNLLTEVANRAEAMRISGTPDPIVSAAKDLAGKVKAQAKAQSLDAVRNALLRKKKLDEIEAAGGIRKAYKITADLLLGRDGVESRGTGLTNAFQAQLDARLRRDGVDKLAVSGELDSEVSQMLWLMDQGAPLGAADNPARKIAEAMKPIIDGVRDRLNMAGAHIGDPGDFVAHTTHDPAKMRAAAGTGKSYDEAFEAWWAATEPRLAEKTFEGLEPRDGETMNEARRRFGRSVFEATQSGEHMTGPGIEGFKLAYEGSSNLAKKLSQPRVLYWKDGTAWAAHMKDFGKGRTLFETLNQTIASSMRQLALMEKLGTNPAANFEALLAKIRQTYRTDDKGLERFKRNEGFLRAAMGQLDGSANRPYHSMWARLGANVRTWESISYLGSVGLTHFASIWPTVTAEMRHHGVSRLGMIGKLVGAMVQGRGSAERQEVMAQLGAYSAGLVRDMHSQWQPDDPIPGRLSSMASLFMKYTGIHYVFDNSQAAVREVLANQLARNTDKGLAEFEPHLANMLKQYGIGEAEWDLLRGVKDLPMADGMRYLTPNMAEKIDPEAAEALLKARGVLAADATDETIAAAVKRLQTDLSDKLYSYYGDAARHSTVTAGARERAWVNNWAQPGSLPGEMVRFVMQFKMWPLAQYHLMVQREIYGSLSRSEAAWNIGIMAALSVATGYLRMAVNDALAGRPQRDPMDYRVALAAAAQGGGIGILGDYLFGEANRFEGGFGATLLGPAASDVVQLVNVYNRWRSGEYRDSKNGPWPDLAHWGVRHVPFVNLIWFKGILDYMAWYHIYEAVQPGWWERTNRRLLKDQGRAMTGYMPGKGVPWTPWGIGASTFSPSPAQSRAIQQPSIQ